MTLDNLNQTICKYKNQKLKSESSNRAVNELMYDNSQSKPLYKLNDQAQTKILDSLSKSLV